ncbi:MAG TPA: hypothetical protein VHN58_12050 [Croceicoccus sp.]|nr:hypothetical protein [Croceicoccus sp.]
MSNSVGTIGVTSSTSSRPLPSVTPASLCSRVTLMPATDPVFTKAKNPSVWLWSKTVPQVAITVPRALSRATLRPETVSA